MFKDKRSTRPISADKKAMMNVWKKWQTTRVTIRQLAFPLWDIPGLKFQGRSAYCLSDTGHALKMTTMYTITQLKQYIHEIHKIEKETHSIATMSCLIAKQQTKRNRCKRLLSKCGIDYLLQSHTVVLSTEHEWMHRGGLQEIYLIKGPSAAPGHTIRLRKLGLVSKRPSV